MSDQNEKPSEPLRTRKPQAPRRTKKVKLALLRKQALTVLSRDIGYLMDDSYKRPLAKDESYSLVNYLKLIKELEKIEDGQGSGTPTDIE